MNEYYLQFLQYVVNTGGNASIANFDEDWEPIGPRLRADLMPTYIVEKGGKLFLTDVGQSALAAFAAFRAGLEAAAKACEKCMNSHPANAMHHEAARWCVEAIRNHEFTESAGR